MTLANPAPTGAPGMAVAYARALVGAGHEVAVAYGPPTIRGERNSASVVEELAEVGAEVVPVGRFGTLRSALRLLSILGAMRRLRPDVVVCVQLADRFVAILAAWLTRTRCVAVVGLVTAFPSSRSLVRRVKTAIYGALLRRCDLVVCVAPHVLEQARDEFRVSPARLMLLYNGVDVAGIADLARHSALTYADLGAPEARAVRLLTVGRLSPEKGHEDLIVALKSLDDDAPRWHLAVVGEGIDSGPRSHAVRLRQLVHDLDLDAQITFLGWRDDVAALLGTADWYVHASLLEGWPLSVLEAMSAGVPVLMSDCSGIPPGFVDGEHGWGLRAGDRDDLERVLRLAVATKEIDRARMSTAVAALARTWDIHVVGAEFVRAVSDLRYEDR